jgi:nucleoside 2-deoxyribosyltransferase
MPIRCFLSSPLSTLAEQNLNATIASIIRSCGYDCYVPQENLPPGGGASPTAVLQHNIEAVTASDLILSVLDKPGSGVVFELAYAFALRKPIVVFRSDKQDYLGKVLEGFWSITPATCKATSLEELRQILLQLQTEEQFALAAAD